MSILSSVYSLFSIACLTILTIGNLSCTNTTVEEPIENTPSTTPTTEKVLRFGIVPQQSPTDIKTSWEPLARYIEEHSDFTVHIKTASSIPEFEKRCAEGEYDIAYMNPYHYVVFHEQAGYQAFAKELDKKIVGILVVAKDSPYEKLEDFAGTEAAFPSPLAFAASLLTRKEFEKRNIAITPVYVRSHDSVYTNVAQGLYPVGGGVQKTLNLMEPEIKDTLRIVWKTEPYTSHAIAASPKMDPQSIAELQNILEGINSLDNKSDILHPIGFQGFEKASDANWNDIRELQLQTLQ